MVPGLGEAPTILGEPQSWSVLGRETHQVPNLGTMLRLRSHKLARHVTCTPAGVCLAWSGSPEIFCPSSYLSPSFLARDLLGRTQGGWIFLGSEGWLFAEHLLSAGPGEAAQSPQQKPQRVPSGLPDGSPWPWRVTAGFSKSARPPPAQCPKIISLMKGKQAQKD